MVKTAAILAGGKGTRLYPLTRNIPKPLVSVKGKPFLHWQIQYLKAQGVTEVVLLISYLAEKIKDYFAQNPIPGVGISYSIEPEPQGTGGAVRLALAQLPDEFWLLNGDSFLYLDLAAMLKAVQGQTWSACMATALARTLGVAGNTTVESGMVTRYDKDAPTTLEHVDAGVYWLRKEAIAGLPQREFDLGKVWPPLIQRRALGAWPIKERYFDIGTPERLQVFAENIDRYF